MKRMENKFLSNIFPQNNGPKVQNESIKLSEISELFQFLQSPQNDQFQKCSILTKLKQIFNSFRMFTEFFSIIDSKSIYIHLINLYLEKTTNPPLKKEILSLISELILSLQTDKSIFDYVYQQLSIYYRGEDQLTSEILNDFLILLDHLYGNTELVQNPKNYIAAVGNCSIDIEINKGNEIIFGTSMSFILNFKIYILKQGNELEHIEGVDQTSDIIKLCFDNAKEFSISLNYPIFCVIKCFRSTFIKQFPNDEWINLIITLQPKDDGLHVFLLANGENNPNKHVIKNTHLIQGSRIKRIIFFENFVGEIGSIVGLNQKENEVPTSFIPMHKVGGLMRIGTLDIQKNLTSREKKKFEFPEFGLKNKELLKKFNFFKKGYWKKKQIDKLLDEFSKERANTIGDPNRKLKDDIIFFFSPIYSSGYFLEDMCERYSAKLNGLIKVHTYFCFQEKIYLIGGVEALIPISEMMFLHQECLTDDILNNFLSIITTILKSRKKNMINALSVKLFETLSLFIERYPAKIFTEKILEAFFSIGRTSYSEQDNPLSSIYFEEILFNEKILAKYSKNLQIKFWSQIELFCQSDNMQIGVFLNMRKVCLILLSYDKKKYYQMCCEAHYNQLKPEYMGDKAIMNPPMTVRLSDIEGIMKSTLDYQKVENAFSLFKLLTLDISPCLVKFIITAFKSVLQNPNNPNVDEKIKWKQEFLNQFFNGKNDIVIANTLRHSLLDVRLEIINLLYEIKKIPPSENDKLTTENEFKKLEKMIKTALLPGDMFYELKNVGNKRMNEISELANHCVNKIKQIETKFPCQKYNNSANVFKENEYENYIMQVFQKLLLWSLDLKIDDKDIFNRINFEEYILKHDNTFQILLQFCDYVDDLRFTKNLFDIFEKICSKGENCEKVLECKPIYAWLLSATFKNYKNNDTYAFNLASKGKGILVDILVKTIENKSSSIINDIEIIMTWGDSIISFENKENLFEFINFIFKETLRRISSKFVPIIKEEKDKKVIINLYQNIPYLIMISTFFQYYILFKNEKRYQYFQPDLKAICLPKPFLMGMKLKHMVDTKTLEKNWLDYPFFDHLFKRISFIWSSKNTFKSHFKTLKSNKNKVIKYEYILDKIILNKDKKNIYFNELFFLCFGDFEKKIQVIPLIKLVPITIACIIQALINELQNKIELRYWIKQFRNFTRFIILASSNISPTNQQELYNKLQTCCLREIGFALCFLKSTYNTISIEKEYLEVAFKDILTFILVIMKSTFNFIDVHSNNMFKSIFRKAKTDLSQCASFSLFQQYVTDKKGIPKISFQLLQENNVNNQFNCLISKIISNDNDYNDTLYCNRRLKDEIDNKFLLINELYNSMKNRCDKIGELKNEIDDTYMKEINELVPLFESELGKYSSNSYVGQKEKKNNYKRIKKHLFSWRGMWSDRNLFYNNVDKLKFRILNHYSKSFLRPILVPILDYEYYLPNFTHFSIDNLFRDTEKVFSLNLDIEKILKSVQRTEEVKENEKNEKVLSENYNRKIYRKSNPELSYAYSNFIDKIELGKEEDIITLMQKNSTNKNSQESEMTKNFYLCCFVKSSHHIKGVFGVLKDRIIFKVFYNQKSGTSLKGTELGFTQKNEDYDSDRKTCFGSYFVWHHKDLDLNVFELQFSDIKFFFRKRYYYRNSGIEIFTNKNKSYYFNFKIEKERERAIGQLLENIKTKEIISDLRETKDKFDNVIGYVISTDPKKKVKKFKVSNIIKSWNNWEISNFEILMWLNFFSNRSYLDLSQYPVMPWVLSDYSDKLTYSYRNLSLPMGMLQDSQSSSIRRKAFIDFFDSLKNDHESEMVPYVYGSHYSNLVYVCNYLTRLFPFSHIMIELSGNKFDTPDRLFLSIESSYFNSTTQKTDVREIIPEFFFLPEMFINLNNLNLGQKENQELVNDVLIPWSSNPYDFVMTLRKELEGGEVSAQINKWIDLIFGYKNRGREAELAYNVFTESSYEDEVEISKYPDKACLFRMAEFGLTPEQVIVKECPTKRDKEIFSKRKDLSECDYFAYESEVKYDSKGDMYSIVKIQIIENDKIAILFNNGTYMQIRVTYSSLEKIYISQISKGPNKIKSIQSSLLKMKKFYGVKTEKTNHVAIYNKGKSLAMGGFFDGFIILVHFEPIFEQTIVEKKPFDNSPVSAIEITKDELFSICGNERGNIFIYSINEKEWSLYKRIFNDFAPINHIFSSDELNLWGSCSNDGYINIYTFPQSKNVRSIQLPEDEAGDFIFLSSSPLPCIVIIKNNYDSGVIMVYTLNGHLQGNQQVTEGIVRSPILMRDFFFNEYIAYISKDTVYLRILPSLVNCGDIAIYTNGITKLCVSENMKLLYGISYNGKNVVIIKDQKVEDEVYQNTSMRDSLINF